MTGREIILAPSLLAADHANLSAAAGLVADAGLKWAHLDIMDGHFVPNLTFGPGIVAGLRKKSPLFFDTHLMLEEPHRYVDAFAEAGAGLISIHVEPDYPVAETLDKIRNLGCMNGIVLNPDTPAKAVLPYLEQVDLVLVMTVQPGFGGQTFRSDMLPKIADIHGMRQERRLDFRLEVDGGIDLESARLCCEQGCDTIVAGTAFFEAKDRNAFALDIKGLGLLPKSG